MKIVDLPAPLDRAVYDEALSCYASQTATRAQALYRVGNVTYPGLSDLDLLVVTDITAIDNAEYFSYRTRLPERLQAPFLHQPFILPRSELSVFSYTSHSKRSLVTGSDVLAPVSIDQSRDESWCRVLEGYCTYRSFFDRVVREEVLRGRHAIAVTSALRFTLRELDALSGTEEAELYGAAIDRIRSKFFRAGPECSVSAAWILFRDAFCNLETRLEEAIGETKSSSLAGFVRNVMSGESSCRLIDDEYLERRRRAISRYHEALLALRVGYGHLFFLAAYDAVPIYVKRGLMGRLAGARYKIAHSLSALLSL